MSHPLSTLPGVQVEAEGVSLAAEDLYALVGIRVQQRLSLPALCELTFSDPPGPLAAAARLEPGTRDGGFMSTSRYRAWRFVHPDLDSPDGTVGLGLSPRRSIAMVDGLDSVRQAILLLLSTIPGERVMRPDYGCQLHRLVFSPNDETTAGLAIHYVRQALDLWEPRIDVLRLDAERNAEDPEQLTISLEYRVRATQQTGTTTFSFNLSGGRR